MSEELRDFLSKVDPNFAKYVENLEESGMSSVDDLKLCSEQDFQYLKIPLFHWKRIMKSVVLENQQPEKEGLGEPSAYNREAQNQAVARSANAVDNSVKQRIIEFYNLYNPERAKDDEAINQLMKSYAGNTTKLFDDLEHKYVLGESLQSRQKRSKKKPITQTSIVTEGLSRIYMKKVRDLEEAFMFPKFHSPLLNPVDFDAKPMVLLVGQYSVGKTSFIKYLLKRDFPGMRIGPEPTTDCFQAIMHGIQERNLPGNAACMDSTKPFKGLVRFGMGFMNKFNVAEVPAPILESISFVDSPGILSGEKQRMGRNYDFAKIVEWFAFKVDRIILLFDAHKLDISDELKMALDCLKGHDDKVRVILNKADQVSNQQLLRVYGALLWSLGKVFKTPEVLRVYVGSYWDKEYANAHNAEIFDAESADLLSDLKSLPRHSATRKINEFVKRTRRLKVHLLIIQHLRAQFGWFGKSKMQTKVLANLGQAFREIAQKNNLNLSDFPPPSKFRAQIEKVMITKLPKIKKHDIPNLDDILEREIPKLMQDLPNYEEKSDYGDSGPASNPFATVAMEEDAAVSASQAWIVTSAMKATYDIKFHELSLQGGKASGGQIMNVMLQSGLQRETLKAIWTLSDIDSDGKMDHEEFALCMFLIDHVKKGLKLPPTLPMRMVPPGKRKLLEFS